MSKSLITKLFLGAVFAIVAGAIAATFIVLWAFASGGFVVSGHDVVDFNGTGFTWTLIGLLVASGFVMLGGVVAGIVAWIGALMNTAQLVDKTWFLVLLVLGLLSFGFFAMVAYVIAGPDSTRAPLAPPAAAMSTPVHA